MRRAALAVSLLVAASGIALAAWKPWRRHAAPHHASADVALGAREELVRTMARAPRRAPAAQPPPPEATLRIDVADGFGAPVAGAQVDVLGYVAREVVTSATSDANGIAGVTLPDDVDVDDLAAIARTPNGDEGALTSLSGDTPTIEL